MKTNTILLIEARETRKYTKNMIKGFKNAEEKDEIKDTDKR